MKIMPARTDSTSYSLFLLRPRNAPKSQEYMDNNLIRRKSTIPLLVAMKRNKIVTHLARLSFSLSGLCSLLDASSNLLRRQGMFLVFFGSCKNISFDSSAGVYRILDASVHDSLDHRYCEGGGGY
jgi:hypothetical protein